MEVWTIWLLVALGIIIIEFFTAGFAVACFSAGAIAASITSLFVPSFEWQLGVFVLVTSLVFVFIRPLVLKALINKSEVSNTNANALIGRIAVVTEAFVKGEGRVKIDGDDWKAVSENDTEVFSVGDKVIVSEINSIILTIKKH